MKKLLVGLIVLAALLSVPMAVSAGTDTTTADVSATLLSSMELTWTSASPGTWSIDYNVPSSQDSVKWGTLGININPGSGWGITVAESGGGADGKMADSTDTYTLDSSLKILDQASAYVDISGTPSVWSAAKAPANDDTTRDAYFRQPLVVGDLTDPTGTIYTITLIFTGTAT